MRFSVHFIAFNEFVISGWFIEILVRDVCIFGTAPQICFYNDSMKVSRIGHTANYSFIEPDINQSLIPRLTNPWMTITGIDVLVGLSIYNTVGNNTINSCYDMANNLPNIHIYHDSRVHGANMGLIWGRQDQGGPHVGPMDLAIWVGIHSSSIWVRHRMSSGDWKTYACLLFATAMLYATWWVR